MSFFRDMCSRISPGSSGAYHPQNDRCGELTNPIVTTSPLIFKAALRDDTPGTQARIIVKEG